MGEAFVPEMEIVSFVFQDEEKEFARHDYCPKCWEETQAQERERSSSRGIWKSKIEPKKPVQLHSQVDRAFALLLEMIKESTYQPEELFVLCLFLARAKRLTFREEFEREGERYHRYEACGTKTSIATKVIELTPEQIDTIQKSLATKLAPIHDEGSH